jgi:hypothetical protein
MAVINKGCLLAFGKPADFINELKGSLWQKAIAKNEVGEHEASYQLISTQFNMGKLNIHVRSAEHPGHGFNAIEPGLEDAYFSILYGNK